MVDRIVAGPGGSETSAESRPAVPEISGYRIIRELGRGGRGVVYEARQTSLGRSVALKVLPFAQMLGGDSLQRFQNEVRAAAALELRATSRTRGRVGTHGQVASDGCVQAFSRYPLGHVAEIT